jgi:hypothetical protein
MAKTDRLLRLGSTLSKWVLREERLHGDSQLQDFHPVLRDTNDSARTKLHGDWQAMPELHRHSCQAQ